MKRRSFLRLLGRLGCAAFSIAWILGSSVTALQPGTPMSQYVHNVWQDSEGLPQNYVVDIAQTTDGYIWLATQEGLARFDGKKFTVFDNQNTDIRENNIQALCSAKNGGLWFGTEGSGLFLLKDGKLKNFSAADGLADNIVESIFEDRQGNVWIGTPKGLSELTDGKLRTFTTKDGLSNDSVLSIYQDHQNTLWIGTEGGGLNSLSNGTYRVYTIKDGLADNLVRALCEDSDGALWAGTQGGLSRLKDGAFTSYTTAQGLSNNAVLSLREDRDRNLWVGTDGGGLNRYRNGHFDAYRKAGGLSDDSVASIFEDVEGDLWVGTYGGGLNRLKDGRFTNYSTETGLSEDEARSILQDHQGNVWIATTNGLNRLSGGKFTAFHHSDGLASDSILSLCEDSEGALWIGTRLGLNRFKNGKFETFTAGGGLSDSPVLSITCDRSGGLWIGTDSGLNRLTNGKIESYSTKDGLTDGGVWALLEGNDGSIWIGTDGGGVDRWKDGKFTSLSVANGLAGNVVFSLYEDTRGSLWIGTNTGLSRLKDGKLATFTRKDGLFDNSIFQILEDDAGNLWMSCDKGIFRTSKDDLNRFADKHATRISSVSYGTADGMKSHECNGGFQPAGCRTGDGKLWFPTTRGVAVIDPGALKTNDLPPPVSVERVVVDGKQIDAFALNRFQPGAERFEFHFTALSFLAPEKVRFKYMLQGFDTDWADAGDVREASYTNLRPGEYTFRVIACNNDGVWNQQGASFGFRLEPHVYQTRWFYGLLAVSLVLAGLGAYQLRLRQMRKRFSAVLVERSRLAREIHDTLSQGFVAIGLQLSAAADRLRDSPHSAEQHIELAQKLVHSSLAEARRSVWDLRPHALEGGNLADALSKSADNMIAGSAVKFDLKVTGTPRALPAKIESNLLRIGQEAVTNSVKHGSPRTISLELSFNNGVVGLRVKDDGRGFDAQAVPNANAGHFGLVGIGERVEQLGGRLTLNTAPGKGTEIAVEVPVQ